MAISKEQYKLLKKAESLTERFKNKEHGKYEFNGKIYDRKELASIFYNKLLSKNEERIKNIPGEDNKLLFDVDIKHITLSNLISLLEKISVYILSLFLFIFFYLFNISVLFLKYKRIILTVLMGIILILGVLLVVLKLNVNGQFIYIDWSNINLLNNFFPDAGQNVIYNLGTFQYMLIFVILGFSAYRIFKSKKGGEEISEKKKENISILSILRENSFFKYMLYILIGGMFLSTLFYMSYYGFSQYNGISLITAIFGLMFYNILLGFIVGFNLLILFYIIKYIHYLLIQILSGQLFNKGKTVLGYLVNITILMFLSLLLSYMVNMYIF